MTTRDRLDPELRVLFEGPPAKPLTEQNLAQFRVEVDRRRATLPALGIEPRAFAAPGLGSAPPVQLLVYRPQARAESRPALLHMHGGGMFSGSPQLSPYSSAAAALQAGFTVASVAYRLAPETRFPGQIEDCYAALSWLHSAADALDIDPAYITVSGDSAGGGLAAALALMARDRDEYSLAAQVLTYPMLDCRTGESADEFSAVDAKEMSWTSDQNRFGWSALRGDYDAADLRCGWFSPSLAADLIGLPPTWIGVGTLDLFHDECKAFASRLAHAGVAVQLEVYRGAPHAFNAVPQAQVAKAWRRDVEVAFRSIAKGPGTIGGNMPTGEPSI